MRDLPGKDGTKRVVSGVTMRHMGLVVRDVGVALALAAECTVIGAVRWRPRACVNVAAALMFCRTG